MLMPFTILLFYFYNGNSVIEAKLIPVIPFAIPILTYIFPDTVPPNVTLLLVVPFNEPPISNAPEPFVLTLNEPELYAKLPSNQAVAVPHLTYTFILSKILVVSASNVNPVGVLNPNLIAGTLLCDPKSNVTHLYPELEFIPDE